VFRGPNTTHDYNRDLFNSLANWKHVISQMLLVMLPVNNRCRKISQHTKWISKISQQMQKNYSLRKWCNNLFSYTTPYYTCYINIIGGFQHTSTSFSTFVKCRPKELYLVPWIKGDIYTLSLLWQEEEKYELVIWLITS